MKFAIILSLALVALGAPQRGRPGPGAGPSRPLPGRPGPSPPAGPSSSVAITGTSAAAASTAASALPTTGVSAPSLPADPTAPADPASCAGLAALAQPVAPTPLPGPADGMVVAAVLAGRGIQNYTCAANSTAAPVAIGAVATLYEISCAAAASPDLLSTISQEAFGVAMGADGAAPPTLSVASGDFQHAGKHFFNGAGVPTFDLSSDNSLGTALVSKGQTSGAVPADNGVAWLELLKADGTTGPVTKMYRLVTVGGVAPATCDGQPSVVSVQYAAQYWVYTGGA